MKSLLGMIIGMEMREWRLTGMRTGICASMECWNSGGCTGLGNLYIFTVVVVVMRYDSNRDVIRVHFGFQNQSLGKKVLFI